MTIAIVTGAGGFIGGRLVHALHTRGFKVWGVDRQWWPGSEALPLDERLQPIELLNLFDKPVNGLGFVYHFGAISNSESKDDAPLKRWNVQYTIDLFLRLRAKNRAVRFAFASSAATFGDGSAGFDVDHRTTRRLKPLSPYAISKHDVDRWFLQTENWKNAIGLKFFNVYGRPRDEAHKGRAASMLGRIARAVQADSPVPLYDVEVRRDFVHVDDAVEAAMLAAESDPTRRRSGLFNVGTGVAHSFDDLAAAVGKALGKTPTIERIPLPDDLAPRYQRFTCANLAAWTAAGMQPRFRSLEHGVADALKHGV